MSHKKLVSFLLLAAAMLCLTLFASAQEDEEEDTTVLQLPNLIDGDEVEGVLDEDLPTQLYVFNGEEGDEVTIEMVAGDDSELDPMLFLLSAQGEYIASNDAAAEDEDTAVLEVELPETSSYFLIAGTISAIGTQELISEDEDDDLFYELSIEGNSEVDDLGTGFSYLAAELLDGEAVEADISDDVPAYFFFFSGEEGDEISISVESDEFDPILYVFAPHGLRIAANDDIDPDGEELNSLVEGVELPEDGIYLVMVSNIYAIYYGDDHEDATYGDFEIELSFD
jgi:hypothetical protein